MAPESSITYVDAKARVVRAIAKISSFVVAAGDFKADKHNPGKRAKICTMLLELNELRQTTEDDIQVMENAVGKSLSLSPIIETSTFRSVQNQSGGFGNLSNYQLPKRKFPTFSGLITEWQGFEDLFTSILSHAPDLPDVERFEYLKTSLEGEPLSLIAHLPLTSANYPKAWEVLRSRYGNKHDLARIHLDALLSQHTVKSNDALSIKTLITSIQEHTAALDNLDFVTRQWSPILVHIFENHLDYDLRARWEITVGDRHQPSTNDFLEFLKSHVRSAEARAGQYSSTITSLTSQQRSSQKIFSSKPRHAILPKVLAATTNSFNAVTCPLCTKPHMVRKCPSFISKSPSERFQLAKMHRLCINCLGSGHSTASCSSKYKCTTCDRSHHSLLHFNSKDSASTSTAVLTASKTEAGPSAVSMVVRGQPQKIVLLSTVLLDVVAADGTRHSIRALFDSGAQASFITEQTACVLMLKRHPSTVAITTFARPTPQSPIMPGQWSHITSLPLADPLYHRPQSIDLLLGADILPMLFLNGKASGQPGEPIALETVFGWILMGPVENRCQSTVTAMFLSISESLDSSIKRFWELEELPTVRHLSPDERAAEEHYKVTTTRLKSGRFMVSLPFRTASPLLGDSKFAAIRRFQALENRLNQDPPLQRQYADFMQDYLDAGHMELIPPEQVGNVFHYYIPHHCVLRPESSTTKLRVVFNTSARTSAGYSLNESLYTGPKLQPDIQVVLLRARLWKYVFMTDIKQMYRQIMVRPADRDYLRILWRFSKDTPVQEYRLCTVTYGTSAAPFQALRTLQELATVDGKLFPSAASILLNDTFVDDILTGANTEKNVLEYQSQLINLCSLAKFELRKWANNNSTILQAVPTECQAMSPAILYNDTDDFGLKILGLKWDPRADVFSFNTKPSSTIPKKRSVLSDIARVFDPLGLLSPITFWTKHVMQQLWTTGITWDDNIPTDIAALWTRYQSELKSIVSISIPRRITYENTINVQLHAFSDSSEKGYSAAVYLRTETAVSTHCHLVTGKSKVAPLKRSTIPRLELCGAVLAAKLLRFVVDTYSKRLQIDTLHAWTDSTTALAWIQSFPHRWATFVANRTSQIHELTSPDIWHHVPTQDNPVDCASRGLFPLELVAHPLWWTGPAFLLAPSETWPSAAPRLNKTNDHVSTEARKCTVLLTMNTCSVTEVLHRFSSFNKIINIVAYCLRLSTSRPSEFTHIVDASERARALLDLVYFVQQTSYSDDISLLTKGLRCSPAIRKLDPFLDVDGFLRVGGRLNNADLPYAHKHPLLLPCHHRLTLLLIDYHHQRLKHPGSASLQATLQHEFWIPSVRKIIQSRIRLCIACYRTRPRSVQPKMAYLPRYRVQQVKPFSITGVDYAGPITLKEARGRRVSPKTAYICCSFAPPPKHSI
ncbi:uncharacterized protein LOC126551703 [Aphis gossypii]|uniref:uncharacterized protein LOC126551703 n=1 Tax=Aphis gossypii TaxID=80765 RepID=UPI00215921D4|nr:uncharacterized protein LOC126551703 [Aphis gossypii]